MTTEEEVFGYVERITFQSEENGYTVAQLQQPRQKQLTCIVGSMPTIQPGESVRCRGNWKRHLVHGRQFEVAAFQTEAPADALAIKKYLGSGLIKGIGPRYADRIVDLFGKDTLAIIDTAPERLRDVAGIGSKRADQISACWAEQRSIRDLMIFLQQYGVSPSFAQKVFRVYGEQAIQKVKENPFRLARDIRGIGFKSADAVAQSMGIAHDAFERIEAGIEFVLSELSGEGHVCFPINDFSDRCQEILQVDAANIEEVLPTLENGKRIVLEELENGGVFIWLKALYVAEKGIEREIGRLQISPCALRAIDTGRAVDWVQERFHMQLATAQGTAVATACTEKVHIITGGPGTGKSTITKAILAITEKLSGNILLAAPTGRAAKRMTEITRKKASTIHTLLEFSFQHGGFKRNRGNPLDCDLIIIDEASMIDTTLMYHLLKAIPDRARLIFVGDINQLPSVGPGNVLKDLIDSSVIAVSMLTEIFRQARGSRIVTNAHRINEGEFPSLYNDPRSDFFFLEAEDPQAVQETIVGLVTRRLPQKYHFDPINDIQVLSPMKRGVVGTTNLNDVLQEALNKGTDGVYRSGQCYRVHDKVMQIRNNYQKEVFNGDVGRITRINQVDQVLTIRFDDKDVDYDFIDLDEVVLAYAVSIHKYQGSECPCVVIPVHTTHFKLLHRNLLYTGVTRGKKLVVLVGTKKAIAIAVHNDEVKKRHTGLFETRKHQA